MNETRELLRRGGEGFAPREGIMDSLIRRRDRKRRNQRIAAGVVGLAVFVALAPILGTLGLPDRSQGPAGVAETGPAEIGPVGPTTPLDGWDGRVDGWDGRGLPPESAAPSTPEEGELVAHHNALLGPDLVFVYADGRVLWHAAFDELIYERRLSPEGLELVLSGEVEPSRLLPPWTLPAHAWADEPRMYVPSTYGICGLGPSRMGDLPPRAEALLSNIERIGDCFQVTSEEARELDTILSEDGVERTVGGGGDTGVLALTFVPASWTEGEIGFRAILPHGELVPNTPG